MYYIIYDDYDEDYGCYCNDDPKKTTITKWRYELSHIDHNDQDEDAYESLGEYLTSLRDCYDTHTFTIKETYPSLQHFKQQFPELFI